jgi:hypothetical protein
VLPGAEVRPCASWRGGPALRFLARGSWPCASWRGGPTCGNGVALRLLRCPARMPCSLCSLPPSRDLGVTRRRIDGWRNVRGVSVLRSVTRCGLATAWLIMTWAPISFHNAEPFGDLAESRSFDFAPFECLPPPLPRRAVVGALGRVRSVALGGRVFVGRRGSQIGHGAAVVSHFRRGLLVVVGCLACPQGVSGPAVIDSRSWNRPARS